jgi:nucleoside-triphosphatase
VAVSGLRPARTAVVCGSAGRWQDHRRPAPGAHPARLRRPGPGFTTSEIREVGRRVRFTVTAVGGQRAVLAHVNLAGPPWVGRYGADLTAFEQVALPALGDPGTGGVVVIDELGKMELASAAFRGAVQRLLGTDCSLVATVQAHRHPFTDALKRRLEVARLDASNRDRLPANSPAALLPDHRATG